jgi:DNA-binding SARP family transcriptional activator
MAHVPLTSSPFTLVVAAAGYGKSTALDVARPGDGLTQSARAALDSLASADWIAIDDLHELAATEQTRLMAEVAALPRGTQVVMASRTPLAPEARRVLRGQLRELGPVDLVLEPYDVRRVLVDEYGLLDPELPIEVHRLTAGWPALVHFAAQALVPDPGIDLRTALASQSAPTMSWLRDEVLTAIPSGSQRLLECLSGLGAIRPEVCQPIATALGLAPGEWSVTELLGTGLMTPVRGLGRDGLWDVVPAVADAVSAVVEPTTDATMRAAARALEDADLPFAAARAHVRCGDWPAALRLLADRGDEILRRGDAAGVVELVKRAPDDRLTPAVQRSFADALRICGDLSGAARAFRPLVAAATTAPQAAPAADDSAGRGWPAALAHRVAAVHYASGELDAALQTLDHADAPGSTGSAQRAQDDEVETVEWMSSKVHLLSSLGRGEEATVVARAALARADATGHARSLTAAHLAMSRVSQGERKAAHLEHALATATESEDMITASRILVNRSFQLLAQARFVEASRAARSALQAADLGIATGRRAAALHNLAEALMHLGEYDEASWHLLRAIGIGRRLGAGRTALGLLGLAEIDHQQGQDERAQARYHEAIELARASQELQVLLPALAGLARLYAVDRDDPHGGLARAEVAADEALRLATGSLRPYALIAAGWVAVRRGDLPAATALARQAVGSARELQAFDLVADALELSAACAVNADDARRALSEALRIWSDGGARAAARRIELQLGWLAGADSADRSRAREAARDLQQLGVRHVNARALTTAANASRVDIAVLGGFCVTVEHAEVPMTAWRSRQARTLLKILAARRGRPATRAWLCEMLWPDDDPRKTGHRLSVLLGTVRGVLDPERRWPTDHYIAADTTGISLDMRHVMVDADTLVRDAEHAAALMDSGESGQAAEILADINERYRGDAFEDEPEAEWADGIREEVRAAWQRSVRRLAALRRRAGRIGDAQTLMVRLLAADPYDEKIHQLLVKSLLTTGRLGEARRAFARWSAAMRELGAPAPDPAILAAATGAGGAPAAHRAQPRSQGVR